MSSRPEIPNRHEGNLVWVTVKTSLHLHEKRHRRIRDQVHGNICELLCCK